MRWKNQRRSKNVDDRRGQSAGFRRSGASPMVARLIPTLMRSKYGRYILIFGVIIIFGGQMLGVDILPLLLGGGATQQSSQSQQLNPEAQELADFVTVVLADTEDTWNRIFKNEGGEYQEPILVLFTGSVNSACGSASAAVGPFYCPGDHQLYIDLSFYDDLKTRHQAPGDFAQAYVIAHEVGHHVQNLLGTNERVRRAQQSASEAQANNLSVRMELQADCYAGLWGYFAHNERGLLDTGDLEEALVAASAIGDDRLQREATGRVVPDSFTHGTSEQRVRWFKKGFDNGDINVCNTFASGVNL